MAIIVVHGYQRERKGLGKSGSFVLNFKREKKASPQTMMEIKALKENKVSKDPIQIKDKLKSDEINSATIGVPPLFIVVAFLIKKPSRLSPNKILGGIIMKAFKMLIKEKMEITVTIMAPFSPKRILATSAAARLDLAIVSIGKT